MLRAGLGLKPAHYEAALAADAPGLWFEVHAENYLVAGGPRLAWLDAIAQRHPVSLHGVAASLGGSEPMDEAHLRQLAGLVRRLQPVLVSEHLAWSRWRGHYLPDLLPVPRTSATLARIASRVDQLQQALGRQVALENPAHYLACPVPGQPHEWDEVEFLDALARRTGCALLLDLNNAHVSARNLHGDAADWVDRFPAQHVAEVHLAGHSADPALGRALLVDSHDTPVSEPVWALWQRFVARAGPRPVLVERDGNLPPFEALMAERERAQAAWTPMHAPARSQVAVP